jgi:predicted alpha/beta-fold hydrolase
MYMYGVSIGAAIAGKYLIENSGKTPIKAVAMYGVGFNLTGDDEFLDAAGWSQYSKIFGQGFCNG